MKKKLTALLLGLALTAALCACRKDAAPLDTAKSLIGEDVSALTAAIGEPDSSSYASSCLGGGEDGEWYYDGFTVYTYRDTDGTEHVYDVMERQ